MADKNEINKNSKRVADKIASAKALFGVLPSDVDLDSAREERLKQPRFNP